MVVGAFLGLSVTSCADKDFDWETAKQQNPEYTFRSNFEKLVGKIDPNQSWDFSSSAKKSTRAGASTSPITVDDEEWYYVDEKTLTLYNSLVEGDNNYNKGKSFTIQAPSQYIAIVPFYQGAASCVWDLHMVVKTDDSEEDRLVWSKHENIQCQLNDETLEYDQYPSHLLSEINDDTDNFVAKFPDFDGPLDREEKHRIAGEWYTTEQSFGLHDAFLEKCKWYTEPGKTGWWESYEPGYNTMSAKSIRTKPIEYNDIPEGAFVYFYLAVWDNNDAKIDGADPRKESSVGCSNPRLDRHMMVALPFSENPDGIAPGYDVIMVGCEDNCKVNEEYEDHVESWGVAHEKEKNPNSDWDMNDLGFMVISQSIKVVEKEVILKEKRYMIEDLGSLSETDVDFNDIVVDFQTYQEVEYTFNPNSTEPLTITPVGPEKQRAILRAMGGTLDFDFFVGDTHLFRKNINTGHDYKDMVNTINPDYSYVIRTFELGENGPWKPEDNNVWVRVMGRTMTDKEKEDLSINDGVSYEAVREGTLVSVPGTTTITFPDKGQTPFIIAFDPSKLWRQERQSIDADWLFGEGSGVDKIPYPEVK